MATADWGPVLGVILNYVEDDLANFVQLDKIAQYYMSSPLLPSCSNWTDAMMLHARCGGESYFSRSH